VQLSRIILGHRYGAWPALMSREPDLVRMLEEADAALLIGDAALRVEPGEIDLPCLDLGEEWVDFCGLPMVFAVWAGRAENIQPEISRLLVDSCQYGLGALDAIIREESERRGFPEYLVQQYLTRNVAVQLGREEEAGLRHYLKLARELPPAVLALPETTTHDDAARSR
jgi:predicted solute-binding protein